MTDQTGTDEKTNGEGVDERLDRLQTEVDRLRSELARLDADLDESRRLNLRAAELLDVVYELLALKPELGGQETLIRESTDELKHHTDQV